MPLIKILPVHMNLNSFHSLTLSFPTTIDTVWKILQLSLTAASQQKVAFHHYTLVLGTCTAHSYSEYITCIIY